MDKNTLLYKTSYNLIKIEYNKIYNGKYMLYTHKLKEKYEFYKQYNC